MSALVYKAQFKEQFQKTSKLCKLPILSNKHCCVMVLKITFFNAIYVFQISMNPQKWVVSICFPKSSIHNYSSLLVGIINLNPNFQAKFEFDWCLWGTTVAWMIYYSRLNILYVRDNNDLTEIVFGNIFYVLLASKLVHKKKAINEGKTKIISS